MQQISYTTLCLIFFSYCLGDKKKTSLAYIDPNPPSPMEKIAETLSKNYNQNPPLKLIVVSFTFTNGQPHKLGKIIAEKVTTELVKKGSMKILDRLMYEKILQDNKVSINGAMDISVVKKIGEILKLDAIVTGMISYSGQGIDINCRMIDAKTGIILSAEETFYVPGPDEGI
ncbi:MAG: hypothetical protein HS129_16270 [Leptospiraceae bacterium]|nr:hypothetical protein [Leptospiraceae bacterium]NUM41916.1 hypothetical protein [Leptospiraceae bacterium]